MSFDICEVLSSPWLYVKTRHIAATSMPTNLWCESYWGGLGRCAARDRCSSARLRAQMPGRTRRPRRGGRLPPRSGGSAGPFNSRGMARLPHLELHPAGRTSDPGKRRRAWGMAPWLANACIAHSQHTLSRQRATARHAAEFPSAPALPSRATSGRLARGDPDGAGHHLATCRDANCAATPAPAAPAIARSHVRTEPWVRRSSRQSWRPRACLPSHRLAGQAG